MNGKRAGCAAAVALCLLSLAPAVAEGALSRRAGGSGYSGTLSSNRTIRKQQLICDPDDPTAGSASIEYPADVVTVIGLGYQSGGYKSPVTGEGFIEVVENGTARLMDLGDFFDMADNPARPRETGYIQVFYEKFGPTGQIDVPQDFVTIDRDPGVTGDQGVDPFNLFFDLASDTLPDTTVARYRIFAATANLHSGNAADFMKGVDEFGEFTLGPSQIGEARVAGAFPEPGAVGLLALGGVGLLARRRRVRR